MKLIFKGLFCILCISGILFFLSRLAPVPVSTSTSETVTTSVIITTSTTTSITTSIISSGVTTYEIEV